MYKFRHWLIVLLTLALIAGCKQTETKILIIGDSISIGYTPFVTKALEGKANVSHNEGNAQHTGTGLEKIKEWIGDTEWDIIQFNWGLWDLKYQMPDSVKGPAKLDGKVTYTLQEYRENLTELVQIMKSTGAKLVFVTTSYVPPKEPTRRSGDEQRYNEVALEIMQDNGIIVNDLHTPSIKIHKEFGQGENNVHYTPEGYEKLSVFITGVLRANL